jgi:hypothetical protein
MAELVKYEQARAALARCVRVDEAKSIRDKAEALRAYGRQAADHELETWAAEIKLRAQRRIGDLSAALQTKPGPGRGKKTIPSGGKVFTLKSAGISTQTASRCEAIASIPEKDFEAFIGEKKAKREPVSAKDAIAKVGAAAKLNTRTAERAAAVAGTTLTDGIRHGDFRTVLRPRISFAS